jgi:hypothetical protein
MRELIAKLNLVPSGGNYETVKERARKIGVDLGHLRGRAPHEVFSDEALIEAVPRCLSVRQVRRALGFRAEGRQGSIRKRIKELRLDTTHFRKGSHPARPLASILVTGRLVQTNNLKLRLIAEGVKEHRCERCLREGWNDAPIPLELDHVNGRRDDNRLENLRLLCPNCHAQTDTYRGRNIGSAAYV